MDNNLSRDLWFAYDGDCPVCRYAANALRIRRDVGTLHLVNARDDPAHPLMDEINAARLDLDTGMVLKFGNTLFHGEDALHILSLLGTRHGWFNRTSALLFRHRVIARICYPAMRFIRNTLLRVFGVGKLRNLERSDNGGTPIFQAVFGSAWPNLPSVMKDHYAVRPFSDDRVSVAGTLNIRIAAWLKPVLRLTGMLVTQSGENVPVTVTFSSGRDDACFVFDRSFRFADRAECFRSRMEPCGGNELIEFVGLGIGWRMAFTWDGARIELTHRGYVWRFAGLTLPVPLTFLFGKGYAVEEPISATKFRMHTHVRHFLFGTVFEYGGVFSIKEVVCGNPS